MSYLTAREKLLLIRGGTSAASVPGTLNLTTWCYYGKTGTSNWQKSRLYWTGTLPIYARGVKELVPIRTLMST